MKRFVRSVPLFTFEHHSATHQDRQPLSGFVFNSLSALGWLLAMASGLCVESCFTRMEQRQRADYFNAKRITRPKWVWVDCFHGKQFVTSLVCVTVTHGAPFHQRHPQWMLRHASLHTRRFSVRRMRALALFPSDASPGDVRNGNNLSTGIENRDDSRNRETVSPFRATPADTPCNRTAIVPCSYRCSVPSGSHRQESAVPHRPSDGERWLSLQNG